MDNRQKNGKIVIFSAPSGAGKSTLINHLLKKGFDLEFSVSATSRSPRGKEEHGREYYFLTAEEFRKKIAADEFLEFEEVYTDCFYGTLRCEVERILSKGGNVILDVDVVGGVNIKKQYGEQALAIFIAPPSVEHLRKRLNMRASDSAEKIEERVAKAEQELGFASNFDKIIVNDNLRQAKSEVELLIKEFLLS